MAKKQWQLNDYTNDLEWYKEDMLNYEDNITYYSDDSVMTFCDFGGQDVVIENEGLDGAIKAFQKARNVVGICQSTGWDTTIYNGYLYYDGDYDDWRADLDLPKGVNFQDYEWENINGTFIQKI